MKDIGKIVTDRKQINSVGGTWTRVIGFTKVDGQSGIWLGIPNGNWCYYEPEDTSIINIVFTACSDLGNCNVTVLIADNGAAYGLQVGSGSVG